MPRFTGYLVCFLFEALPDGRNGFLQFGLIGRLQQLRRELDGLVPRLQALNDAEVHLGNFQSLRKASRTNDQVSHTALSSRNYHGTQFIDCRRSLNLHRSRLARRLCWTRRCVGPPRRTVPRHRPTRPRHPRAPCARTKGHFVCP
jgi:hypothetical protein